MPINLKNFIKEMNNFGKNGIPFLFIIDYEMINPEIFTFSEAAKSKVFFSVKGLRNFKDEIFDEKPLHFVKNPVDYAAYHTAFKKILEQIKLGNTFLLNLTFPTEIDTNWELRRIFEKSSAPYRLLYKDRFVLFSPECFMQISNGIISSFPMKGTIDASIKDASSVIVAE